MKNLKKIVSVSILFTIILVLSVASMVHAVGVTATIQVSTGGWIAYDSGMGEIFGSDYATNSSLPNSISVISDKTNSLVGTVIVGSFPAALAYDSGKGEIFVVNAGSDSVSVISDSNNSVDATIAFPYYPYGSGPDALAYDSGMGEIFAITPDNTVSVISDTNNTVIATVPAGDSPWV